MRSLLRLYPRAWRDRYEDEFLASFDGRDLSLSDTVDIVLGALDARLDGWSSRGPREIAGPALRGLYHARLAASLLMLSRVVLLAPPVVALAAILPAHAQIPNLIGLLSLALSGAATLALRSGMRRDGQSEWTGGAGVAMVLVPVSATLMIAVLSVLFASAVPAWLALVLPLSFNAGWAVLGVAEIRRGKLPILAPLAVAVAGVQGTLGSCLVLILTILHGAGTVMGISWVLMANPLLAAAWILLALALWAAAGHIRPATV